MKCYLEFVVSVDGSIDDARALAHEVLTEIGTITSRTRPRLTASRSSLWFGVGCSIEGFDCLRLAFGVGAARSWPARLARLAELLKFELVRIRRRDVSSHRLGAAHRNGEPRLGAVPRVGYLDAPVGADHLEKLRSATWNAQSK